MQRLATMTSPKDYKKPRKPRTINPTPRQKIAAKLMAENLSQNLAKSSGEVLREAGYDISTSEKPQLVTNTAGYKQELAKWGLTEELITTSLAEDIKAKPKHRVQELSLAADILSMRKRPEQQQNTLNVIVFSPEQQERIAARIINRGD